MVRWVLALIAVLVAGPALAAESDAVRSPQAEVRLISDVDAIAPGQPFRVALYQKLATGWHTYWTNPGDAGQPPELTLVCPRARAPVSLRLPPRIGCRSARWSISVTRAPPPSR